MTAAVLTPFVTDPARNGGNRIWRKKLLPVGTVNYKGRVLQFTKDYLAGLARNFSERAYDQVPFQLAPDDNKHTNDVERFAGDITDMTVEPDGLWITLAATERGDKVLMENPKCGVSARIVEDYDRSDGKFFDKAVQHVLATLDPRIPGLGGWQAIEASNSPEVTLDLSGYEFSGQEEGEATVPLTEEEKAARMAKLLEIPPEQIDKLLAGIEGASATPEPPEDDDENDIVAWVDGLSDEEILALEAEFEAEAAASATTMEPATLSNEHGALEMAVEMTNVRADENARQLKVVQDELDDQRYAKEKSDLARNHGIPPYITELAKPLLHGANHVIDLSGGQSVDAGQIMRKVLSEVGKMTSMLGVDIELGTGMDEPEGAATEAASQARSELVDRFKSQTRL